MTAPLSRPIDRRRRQKPFEPDPNRRWALFASYFFLVLFAIFFLMPPYLHGGDLVEDRRRGRPHGDQSLVLSDGITFTISASCSGTRTF